MHNWGWTRIDLRQVDKRKCADLSGGDHCEKTVGNLAFSIYIGRLWR